KAAPKRSVRRSAQPPQSWRRRPARECRRGPRGKPGSRRAERAGLSEGSASRFLQLETVRTEVLKTLLEERLVPLASRAPCELPAGVRQHGNLNERLITCASPFEPRAVDVLERHGLTTQIQWRIQIYDEIDDAKHRQLAVADFRLRHETCGVRL